MGGGGRDGVRGSGCGGTALRGEGARLTSSAWWVAVGLGPVLVAAAIKVRMLARPYWSHYYDPEAIFFYDGIRLAHGLPPNNVDHPGAPTQFLSALIVILIGDDPLAIDRFRHAAYVLSWCLLVIGAVFLHRAILQRLEPGYVVACFWAWLSFPTAVRWTSVWTTEALYFPFGALTLAAAWRFAERRGISDAALLGASLGLLVSLKFLFLSWLPAGFAAVLAGDGEARARRLEKLTALAGTTAAVFVAMTLPSLDRYRYMASWLWKLASRSGEYGSGKAGLPSAADAVGSFAHLVSSAKGWFVLLSVSLAWLLVSEVRRVRGGGARDGATAFAVTAFLLSSLAVVRANGSGRYMLPAGLAGLMIIALASLRVPARFRRTIAAGALAATAFLVARCLVQDHAIEGAWAARGPKLRAELASLLETKGISLEESTVVFSFRFPDPAFALRIMTNDPRMYERIEERFPRTGHYNPWLRELHLPRARPLWDVLVVSESDVPCLPFPVGPELGRIEDFVVLSPPDALSSTGARVSLQGPGATGEPLRVVAPDGRPDRGASEAENGARVEAMGTS